MKEGTRPEVPKARESRGEPRVGRVRGSGPCRGVIERPGGSRHDKPSPPNDNHLSLCQLLHTSSSSVAPVKLLSSENSMHTLLDGWMDGWSSHPQTGGSSVLGLLGLGRCSTSSCRLTGMAITRHTGNGTHLVSGSLLWVILFFVLASILLVTLLWICLSGLL